MNILVVGAPKKSNQVKRLKEEAQKRGHQLDNCPSYHLTININQDRFLPTIQGQTLKKYQLVYFLVVGKRKWEWYVTGQYLQQKYQTTIVESKMIDPHYHPYFTPTSHLLKEHNLKLPFPQTSVLLSSSSLDSVLKNHQFPLIFKVSELHRGEGVYKVNSKSEINKLIKKHPDCNAYFLKEFIPSHGDIRVFVVGSQAVGAMRRLPPKNSFKANISQGATAKPFNLQQNPHIRKLAEKITQATRSEITGVDIITHKETQQPYILELNRGPQFDGLEKYTNTNVALEIIKYFEKKVN